MKNSKTLFGLALFASVLFTNCTVEGTDTNDDTSNLPCYNYNKDLLTLNTAFNNDPNAVINYNSFIINNLNSSFPIIEGNLTTSTDLTYQLPTSGSLYNETNSLHGVLVTRAAKYFTFNTNSGTGQEFTTPTNISAPIQLGTSAYVIEVANAGYANSGVDDHFKIKPFNINDGTTGAALPISTANTTFNNNSFFLVESMSSASNGIDEIYFLSGTNLITVNTITNTASHIDIYPSFSMTDFVRFFGLEYSESLGLIAVMDTTDFHVQNLIKINPSNGTYIDLLTIPALINSEFYSSTYSECNKTYYLTSLDGGSTVQTNYFEFDLAGNTVSNTQIFSDYVFGIELIN